MQITHRAAVALKDGQTHSEPVAGRGSGSLLLVGRKARVSCYYRYKGPDGKRPWIELGALTKHFSLAQARQRCAELAGLKREHPDLKRFLEEKERSESEALRREALEQTRYDRAGTFRDMLTDYIGYLASTKRHSEPVVRKALTTVVIEGFPALMEIKASEIGPDDVVLILKSLSDRQVYTYRNRIRSYLHAAFQYAVHHEYDETRTSDRIYGIQSNPVALIPVLRHAERALERALSNEELRQFYRHVDKVNNVSPQMGNLVRFLVEIGGQRPLQVLRAEWSDYDLVNQTMLIRDYKGRSRSQAGLMHLLPLSDRAMSILLQQRERNGQYHWPFTSQGKIPITIESLKNVSRRFLDSDYAVVDGGAMEHFTARDIRRTCKQIMIRAGIRRDLRNLLQNHGQTGVDVAHYGNDPSAFLPEKLQAMSEYSAALQKVLDDER